MAEKFSNRLREALRLEAIPTDVQLRILNFVANNRLDNEPRWFDTQLKQLRQAINSLRSGKSRGQWAPHRVQVYDQYLEVLLKTERHIVNVREGTPEEPRPSQQRVRTIMAQRSRARVAAGLTPLGEYGQHWSSWIPPHVRRALVDAFRAVYALPVDQHLAGRRVIPFATIAERVSLRKRWLVLRATAQSYVDVYNAHSKELGPNGAHTMHKVMLERRRAGGAAVRAIDAAIRDIDTGEAMAMEVNPDAVTHPRLTVPPKWTDMLTKDERARLREAESNDAPDANLEIQEKEPDTQEEDTALDNSAEDE